MLPRRLEVVERAAFRLEISIRFSIVSTAASGTNQGYRRSISEWKCYVECYIQ